MENKKQTENNNDKKILHSLVNHFAQICHRLYSVAADFGFRKPNFVRTDLRSPFSILHSKKFAMTMAEIMIVMMIVAVISLVFVATPKKNTSKMNKAKYYIAYDMLKRLQDEQIANTGEVKINQDDDHNFSDAVGDWLNVLPDGAITNCTVAHRCKALTNGMMINWDDDQVYVDGSFDPPYGGKRYLLVRVDIDGGEEAPTWNTALNEDVYEFLLFEDGLVVPRMCYNNDVPHNNNGCGNVPDVSIRLPFRVYRYTDNGGIEVLLNNTDYLSAYSLYKTDPRCKGDRCVMEAIPPLR